eukprot:CAMPEP_0115477662 /NCGR_PEP_ID=MMETSP0271-20121206/55792_1 /TAXON_ID=71861 /ORGANISM="Scrippsiella trochoidea, Strain CCMP3099" /LENGTH=45 /DNA_ID= /DNA_START= /DNA_END= /DNA_ORIENTATION=
MSQKAKAAPAKGKTAAPKNQAKGQKLPKGAAAGGGGGKKDFKSKK